MQVKGTQQDDRAYHIANGTEGSKHEIELYKRPDSFQAYRFFHFPIHSTYKQPKYLTPIRYTPIYASVKSKSKAFRLFPALLIFSKVSSLLASICSPRERFHSWRDTTVSIESFYQAIKMFFSYRFFHFNFQAKINSFIENLIKRELVRRRLPV